MRIDSARVDRVAPALEALAAGRPAVLVDDEAGAGDLVIAAAGATGAPVAFVVRHSTGFLEVALDAGTCCRLRLSAATGDDGSAQRVSVDRRGRGTGISAADRAATLGALADPASTHDAFTRPGHVVPLRAEPGGVLVRRGRVEAAADLAILAGLPAAAALAGLVSPARPSEMAGPDELEAFAAEHDLPVVTIAEVHAHRRATEPAVERAAVVALPTDRGAFAVTGFHEVLTGATHLVLSAGDLTGSTPVPLHVRRECLSGDVLRSTACSCAASLAWSMATIEDQGRGLLVYLRPRGAVRACGLTDVADDEAAASAVVVGALRDLGIEQVLLVDATPGLATALRTAGVAIGDAATRTLAG